MKRLIRLLCAGCLSALLMNGVAVAAERDPAESETWVDLSAQAKIVKGTSLTVTQNLRWDEMFGRIDLYAPEASVRHRLRSWWRLEGGYRYLRERDSDEVFQHRHRLFANTRFRARTEAANFELRVQWQEEFRHELDDGTPERHFLRTRAKAKLRGDDVSPYASVEMYHRLDGADDDIESGTMTKLRLIAGVEWERGDLTYDARYLMVVPVHDETDPLQYVVSVGVGFDLPW